MTSKPIHQRRRPTQAGSTRKLFDIAFGYSNYRVSWWKRLFAESRPDPVSYISGSGVYKFVIHNQSVDDVDVLVDDPYRFARYVRETHPKITHPSYQMFASGTASDISVIRFPHDIDICYEHKLDVMSFEAKGRYITEYGLSPLSCLVLARGNDGKESVKHILETEVARFIIIKNFSTDDLDLIEERKWAIRNLESKQYCEFSDMRPKDKKYFQDWKIISEKECAKHGIFKFYNEGGAKTKVTVRGRY